MSVICIIPARGGSKRLHKKNIKKVCGKPMIQWSIEACLKSELINRDAIYVSSEDDEILELCESLSVNTINRPVELSADDVWTQDVLKHAVSEIGDLEESDIIVRVQANSPQVTSKKIDECILKLLDANLWEVFTINPEGVEDAAIHVMRLWCVNQSALSVYKGVVLTNYIDIHTQEDLELVESIMSKND
jgi:CMP-N-acetylneuraminic acid synthetase